MTHVRPFVRPLVRPLVRSGAVGPYGGLSYQDGIHLNFASGSSSVGHYVKVPGAAPTVSAFTSLFTFTCGNQSMFMGPNGLLVQAVTNVPRIEYDANGNCLGLLMEASRTNLWLQSQDFATSHLSVGLNAVTTNATTAPDGTLTADRISEDTSGAQHRIRQSADLTITSGSTNTLSVFVKADQKTHVSLRMTESTFASSIDCIFNLVAGTAGVPVTAGAASGAAARIQPAGNGWFRCSISGALNGGFLTCRALIELLDATNTTITYTGGGTAGLFVWGGQFEAGAAFPSSYIPTTTVAVPRTADSCIRTLGSEFSATAGTVVLQGRTSGGQESGAGQTIIEFDDATSNERHTITRAATSDTVRYNIFDGGVLQSSVESAALGNREAFKSAWAWALNDIAQSTNGGTVNTDTSATLPTVTQLVLAGPGGNGNSFMNGHILRFDYWPERRSNAFLQQAST